MNNQKNYNRNSNLDQFGKVPPQAVDIEEVILGALMLEKTAIERIENILPEDCFYNDSHNIIYKSILQLNLERKAIDLRTVTEQVKKSGKLDVVGGPFYIAQLTNKVGSSAHIETHSYILLEKYIRRTLISLQDEIQNAAFDETIDIENVLTLANNKIEKINDLATGAGDSQHIKDIARKCITALDERTTKAIEGKSIGVPTGFKKLDEVTAGWQPGELMIYAARPGVGKTAVMLHHARNAAEADIPVCIYSLEMTSISLTDRAIISVADIDPLNYKTGKLKDEEYVKIEKALSDIEKLNIYIDDNARVSMKYIKSHIRKMKKKGKCGIVMIDYLQLVEMDGSYNETLDQKIAQATREAKILAKEFNIPVILLAQLNRDIEKRGGDKRPQLSDLKGSGAIEQDADMVIFIDRPNYYGIIEDADGNDISDIAKLIIAKFRNGNPQDIKIKHNKSLTRFVDEGETINNALPF